MRGDQPPVQPWYRTSTKCYVISLTWISAFLHPDFTVQYYYCRHLCVTGVLGIKVKIMLPWDPSGKIGPKRPLPDNISIVEPKEETPVATPYSEHKGAKPADPVVAPGPMPGMFLSLTFLSIWHYICLCCGVLVPLVHYLWYRHYRMYIVWSHTSSWP